MHAAPISRLAHLTAVGLTAMLLGGCGDASSPTSGKEAPPTGTAPGPATSSARDPGAGAASAQAATALAASPSASAQAASPSPSAQASAATGGKFTKPAVPTLTPERLASPAGFTIHGHFLIDGAVIVAAGPHVGRAVSNGVLWLGRIPQDTESGTNKIHFVQGRWPDRVDVVYKYNFGPTLTSYLLPLKEKVTSEVEVPVGDSITDVVNVGETTLVATWTNNQDYKLRTARGPELARKPQTAEEAKCPPDLPGPSTQPAVWPQALEASRTGTLVSIGLVCRDKGAAAEIWDTTGKSRIVDLSPWLKAEWLEKEPLGSSYPPRRLLRGKGDELWYFAGEDRPLLHYKDGKFEVVQGPAKPIKNVLTSASGDVHASDGRTIFRLDGEGKWIPMAKLPWPRTFSAMAMVDQGVIWGDLWRLRDKGGMEAREDCAAPFVYLAEVGAGGAEPTQASIRKVLSSFPGAAELSLVEFGRSDKRRRLGVAVSTNAQGEAVIEHVKAALKDEEPLLLCHKPEDGQKIEIGTGEK